MLGSDSKGIYEFIFDRIYKINEELLSRDENTGNGAGSRGSFWINSGLGSRRKSRKSSMNSTSTGPCR